MGAALRTSWRQVLVFIALVIGVTLANVPTLFRGTPPAGSCGTLVPFLPGLDRFENCDSPLFNRLAQDYGLLVTPEGMTRQGRPGYMALGWLLDRALQVLTLGRYDPLADGAPTFVSAEAGYLLLNAVVLATAVFLVIRMLGAGGRAAWGPTLLATALLVANPVTRAFFWTAHSQMFNILVPSLAIALTAAAWRRPWSSRRALVTGLLVGLGMTTYGTFAVVAGSVGIALALHRHWRSTAVFIASSILPVAAWWLYVRTLTGTFYSVETVHYRQFIWILDGLRDGTLPSQVVRNVGSFMTSFADAQTFLALALVLVSLGTVTAGLLMNSHQPRPESLGDDSEQERLRPLVTAVGVVLPVQITFSWLMGFYQTRLSWGLLVTAIVSASLMAAMAVPALRNAGWLRRVNALALVLAVGWYATWLSIAGPWH